MGVGWGRNAGRWGSSGLRTCVSGGSGREEEGQGWRQLVGVCEECFVVVVFVCCCC